VQTIVPLEDILHAGCLILELEHLLPSVLRLELRQVLLDKVELDHMLYGLLLRLSLGTCGPVYVVQMLGVSYRCAMLLGCR